MRKTLIAVVAASALVLGVTACEGSTTKTGAANAEIVQPDAAAAPAPVAAPSLTAGQKNAIRSAESYLDFSSFSRSGLIEQLEFEGFSTADATYAVDRLNVDWNAQAVGSAESYLDFSAFSHSGLVEQLEFEGFTPEQAEFGAAGAGL